MSILKGAFVCWSYSHLPWYNRKRENVIKRDTWQNHSRFLLQKRDSWQVWSSTSCGVKWKHTNVRDAQRPGALKKKSNFPVETWVYISMAGDLRWPICFKAKRNLLRSGGGREFEKCAMMILFLHRSFPYVWEWSLDEV